jgi:hypothetical protein
MTDDSASVEQRMSRLVQRASQDVSFRKLLLADPKAAIAQELGVTIPDEIEVYALEETPTRFYLVVPAQPETQELSDQEMAGVAGGISAELMNSLQMQQQSYQMLSAVQKMMHDTALATIRRVG